MPEVLSTLREQLQSRLKELEPMIEEHSRISRALELLTAEMTTNNGRSATATGRAAPRSRVASGKSKTQTRRTPRVRAQARRPAAGASAKASPGPRRRGARREELLAVIRARPGTTIAEAARAMGVKPTYLYRLAADLQKSGALKKDGRGYHCAA